MTLPSRTTDVIYSSGSHTSVDITVDYVADSGSTTYFTSTLNVEVGGVLRTVNGYGTYDYTITSLGGGSYRITFNTIVNAALLPIHIYRRTTRTSSLVVFPSATSLDAQVHLNKSVYQWLFLVQELYDMLLMCIRIVVNSTGIYWDFLSYQGKNCLDPTAAQDVATKNYVDVQDTAIMTHVDSQDTALTAYIDAHDATTLASAQTYTRAYVPTVTALISSSVDCLIPHSQIVAVGTTRVYLPIAATAVIVAIDGVTQAPITDYTHTSGNNYIDLVIPTTIEVTMIIICLRSTLGTTTLTQEEHTLTIGATTLTTTYSLNNFMVFIDGILQAVVTDFNKTADKQLTFTKTYEINVTVSIVHLISV